MREWALGQHHFADVTISLFDFIHLQIRQDMEREDPRGTNEGLKLVSKRLFLGSFPLPLASPLKA
jgi:hypothetical protein